MFRKLYEDWHEKYSSPNLELKYRKSTYCDNFG